MHEILMFQKLHFDKFLFLMFLIQLNLNIGNLFI